MPIWFPKACARHTARQTRQDLIAETVVIVDAAAEDMSAAATAARKVGRLLGDLETYVSGQSNIDYATAVTESTVQWLLHRE
jgi:hypothetical protein